MQRLRRRVHPDHPPRFRPRESPVESLARAPILAVAVDMAAEPAMLDAMRAMVGRAMRILPGARVACLCVLRQTSSRRTPRWTRKAATGMGRR
jgi:hypothetical protein